MSEPSFDVLALAPAAWAHPGVAVSAARAGGVGLLDLEFCTDAGLAHANFARLLSATSGSVGLHVPAAQFELARDLLAHAGERALTVLLSGPFDGLKSLDGAVLAHHRTWLQVTRADDLDVQLAALPKVTGLVAKGHEAPGWVGEDSSYILIQKLLRKTSLPIYVRGGVGLHTAAGCRAAGAAGVVLDDQVLLLDDSALPESLKNELARLVGAETRLFGELIDAPCRVYAKPAAAQLKHADADARLAEAGTLAIESWRQALDARIGWDDASLLPVGQGIGAAAIYRARFKRIGRLIQALRKSSFDALRQAAELGHLAEGSALAQSQGTRYPLAQGPMTRVSDSPAFAASVTENGALPFLALALMRGDQVLDMLEQTAALAGDRAWGVGMLGFIPQALRDEQCEAIWKCKPPYALIAGGRPDQAAAFESRGIKTYIHAPAPALLKMYLEQGAKRFVFEGRECGGHIGPIASFPLWEQMIEVLLENVKPGSEADIHLLFAGGISDARSGAMLAALTAPLAARGMKVGALMGTAYLFTHEIVATGAIVQGFQEQAVACARTVNLETGPGHATRCADTKFAHDFFEARRALMRENRNADEIRDTLEDLNLGRLRIASKGKNRDESGKVVDIDPAQQLTDGMYMIGQVATLTDAPLSIAELHDRVSNGGHALLQRFDDAVSVRIEKAQPSDIAIVGIGLMLPKAQDAEAYWDNVLGKVNAITEVPRDRWDWRLYFDADRNAKDKIYSKWGGFIDEVLFDPTRYGIPPNSMKSIDPLQLLTLEAVNRALEDAGLDQSHADFDREHTSVILGASGGAGDLGLQYGVRSELPRFVADLDADAYKRLPEWSNESFAGVLLNVAAGRVTNRMDFGGLNFTIDAACASSLAALSMACNELESGRSNVAITGGVDTVQSPYGFMCFAKTGALSPDGKAKAFDKKADGIVISEGVTMVVLKRLADAEAAGDRIYAVIKAVAGSSDGKALGMTAPRPDGQIRALNRAYGKAGFSPATLGMLEAHGTGTAVGDKAEAETITRALKAHGASAKTVALGSVKTILGHTKASAGIAGLVKLALSLHHRVLPAHANVDDPLDAIAEQSSPAFLLKEPKPWLANVDGTPRRGGVSAFGFGGTNFHAVLEEYRDGMAHAEVPGARSWTQELIVFRAADAASLKADVERVLELAKAGPRLKLALLAASLAREADRKRGSRALLAFATRNRATLIADLELALARLAGDAQPLPPHIKLALERPLTAPALAFVFPGQGAQYVNMGLESALFVEELRSALERADRTLATLLPERLSRRVWPESAFNAATEVAQQQQLTDTRYAQPAIGTLSLGYLNLARRLGLQAVATAGHSYGEFAALHAAGVIDEADFLKLSATRGSVMAAAASSGTPGGMAAVSAARDKVADAIAAFAGVKVANHNAPEQTVISGPAAQIDAAVAALSAAGLRVTRLPVSGAFHTELMEPAKAPLSAAIADASFNAPTIAVYSNGSGARYPDSIAAMRAQLDAHLLSSVEFVREIEAMYADGVRVFLELGPKSILSNMIGATLAGRDARCVSLDGQGGGLRGLLSGLADLLAAGVDFELSRLFAGRPIEALPLARVAELAKPATVKPTAWYLSGGYARPHADPIKRTGVEPPMTLEKAAEARQAIVQKIADSLPKPEPVVVQAAAPVSAPVHAPAMPVAASAQSGDALAAYHETMRQFLSLQERVMAQFLGGSAAPAAMPMAAPVQMPVHVVAAVQVPVAAPVQIPAPVVVAAPAVMVAAVPTPAASAAPTLDTAALSAMLLRLVADRTGYPEDMLSLDADLEAELGIDSIKRVEIAGSLQKALPAALGEAMQSQMERYTRAKTLRAIVEPLAGITSTLLPAAATSIAVTQSVASTMPSPAAPPVSIDVQASLLKLVADRTGYPEDMLSLDADLEADLGIDSIKRVEIVGAFQKSLPASVSEALQSQMEKLTRAKNLRSIVDAVQPLLSSAVPVSITVSVTAPAPLAVAAAVSFDARDLLLTIVADRTGYPSEMLALDADLEADLGIDSIKRVEIVGALQKQLPTEIGAAMQAAMESFTRAKSLATILERLSALGASSPASAAVAAAPVIVQASVATSFDARELLLGIVADRTGYPAEMLALDADLEADLGIDSIKRVEIVGALQKQLPAEIGAAMQAAMESFTRAKSLAIILERIAALGSGSAAPSIPSAPIPTAASEPVVAQAADVPRYVIRPRPAPLTGARVKLSGPVIVAGGRDAIVLPLIRRLESAGLKPIRLDAIDAATLSSSVARIRAEHGVIAGVIHLHGLSEDQPQTLVEWQQLGERSVISLFRLLQPIGEGLANIRVIAASRLGGTFGRDAVGPGTPLAGGLNGMLNCVRDEYPQATLRAVDFNGQTDDTIASHLADELLADDRSVEAGHTGDARYSVATVEEALADTPFAPHLQPAADWVVLATGGARGITAELLEEMVVPGITLVLLGRTPEPAPESSIFGGAIASATDPASLKRVLIEQMRERGEMPKPVEIDRAVQKILTEREVRANLQRLRAKGATVGYFACDVRNEAAFGGVIDGIYANYGRIDAVLHGAGVIEDKRIADKSDDSFARVLNTKLDSSFILTQKLRPETLKLLVFFTSVAGRYGNRGQIDYAAANEACNRLAWTLSRRWPETRVIAANWGPWDAGMASEGVKRQFRERGIEPIPVDSGRRYFLRELACGPKHEVELVIGKGPWQQAEVASVSSKAAASQYPLVRGPLRMGAGGALVLTHRFGLDSDPYLGDHMIDGKPVLPAAAATEWVAQVVGQGWPGWQVAEVQELRTLAGVVLEPGATREIEIRAKATSHSGPGEQTVTVDIADPSRKAPLYRASVRLVEHLEAPVVDVPQPIAGLRMDPHQTYERMLFHTGRFRLLTEITAVAPAGVDAMVSPSSLGEWIDAEGEWLFDPGLIDVAAQLAWIWGRTHRQQSALPSRFGRVLRVPGLPKPKGPLSLRFRIKPADHDQAVRYDAVFIDEEGRVRLAMLDAESTLSAALNRIGSERL
ncbi:SDR family NAD(P)-dependent oxidoreductase [Hydrocarboniphaga effusa]|uniref:SDR family NAD(P)-dependent oxidoreductase n=2 Tax=Hydrocarboniphaga effusa TaxID=243629 RepID=UPI003BAAC332